MALTQQQKDAIKEQYWPQKADKAARDEARQEKCYDPDPTDPSGMRPRVPPPPC